MKFEKYLFYFLVILHLIPVIILPYFVTHDGPAHVYNANLIYHLLFESNSAVSDFFRFNPQILPNWISHLLLGVFALIMAPENAEKLVIILYTITFPLAFRSLVLQINPSSVAASYLVFPFLHAFCILTGLYSFCLGLCLMFYVLSEFRKSDNLPGKEKIFWFSVCMLLIFFSHLFAFMLTMFCIGFMITWNLITKEESGKQSMDTGMSNWWKRVGYLLLVSAIPLILTGAFTFHQACKTDTVIPEFNTMLKMFLDIRPVIALNYMQEQVYSRPLLYIYIVLFFSAIYAKVQNHRKNKARILVPGDGWLLLSMMMTVFYFILPDDIFSGGIVAIRFSLMSFLFLILWFAALSPQRVVVAGAVVSVVSALLLLNVRYPALRMLSNEAKDFATCESHIEEGKTLLTLNYSDNWMMDNVASYIADRKCIILLDNYEANQVHFPLMWKPQRNPDEILGNAGKSNRPCIDLNKFKRFTGKDVEYILVMKQPAGLTDSCTIIANEAILVGYKEIFRTPVQSGILYRKSIRP